MKLQRKIEHYETVCPAQEVGSYTQGQGHNQVRGQIVPKIVFSYTTEANLVNLHRKIKHNEKVCHPQNFDFYAQGQGHNQVTGQNRILTITQKLLKQI